jgi:hypothetical protein
MERKMSRDLLHRAIIDNEEIRTARQKLLLLTLLRYGDHEGKSIYPGKNLLARKLNCTPHWVKMMLRDLEQDGFIIALDKKGGRGHKSHYEINLVKLGIEAPPETEIQVAKPPENIPQTIPPAPLPEWVESNQDRHAKLVTRLELRRANMERHPSVKLYRDLHEETLVELRALESELQVT